MSYHKLCRLLCIWLSANLLVISWATSMMAAPLQQVERQEQRSTTQRIRERGNILIAGVKYDFPPFGFEDAGGTLQGFDIDLINAFAEVWGVQVEFVKVTADARIPLLMAGEIDIVAASLTHTQEREAAIDFSQTYFVDGQSVLVRKEANIDNLLDLTGKRIGAIQGTTSILQIAKYAQTHNIMFSIVPFAEYLPALDALDTGTIEALTSDRTALAQFAKENPHFQVIGEPFTQEPYGFGVQAGDSLFRHLVDATLQQIKVNGKYDDISKKWFPSLEPHSIMILPGQWQYSFETSPDIFRASPTSLVEKIQHRHNFTVGIVADAPPFSSLDETGACCIGFAVDLMKEFARRWTHAGSTVVFKPIASSRQLDNLGFDQWDIFVTSLPHRWELEEAMDFSQPYLLNEQIAPADAALEITSTVSTAAISLGLPTGDDQFRDLINFTLQTMTKDGTYQYIFQRWFPDQTPYQLEIWPGIPTDLAIMPGIITSTLDSFFTKTPATSIHPQGTPSLSVISIESIDQETESKPTRMPNTGVARYSNQMIFYVVLLIITLLGGAIYYEHIRKFGFD